MRSAVDTVVLVMAWSLEVGDGMARAWFWGMRGNEEGRPEGRPMEFARTLFCASLARDAKLGMRNGDVLRPALERRDIPGCRTTRE